MKYTKEFDGIERCIVPARTKLTRAEYEGLIAAANQVGWSVGDLLYSLLREAIVKRIEAARKVAKKRVKEGGQQ